MGCPSRPAPRCWRCWPGSSPAVWWLVMGRRRPPGRRAAVTDLADCPLLLAGEKITASHRARDAYVYVRQSTLLQVRANTESLARQYDLRQRAVMLGWPAHQVVVVDEDLGRSGASAAGRSGFSELVADVGLGKAGIVLALECSRLARSNADWYQLLDLCALTDTDRRHRRHLPPGQL